jgi:hypothetical protein
MGIGAIIKINNSLEDLPVSEIEVVEKLGESTRFRLRLPVAIDADGDLPMLSDPRIDPGAEVTILVESKAGRDCLVKGIVHAHEIHLENGGEGSHVDVLGADRMVVMNRQNKAAIWADGPATNAVKTICGTYGLKVDDIEATNAEFSEAKHSLVQRETDLAFVRRLARHNGSLFWITCDLEGVEAAHFRRPDLAAAPTAEIALNQGKPSDPFRIEFDVERPVAAKLSQHDFAATSPIKAELAKQPLAPLGKKGLDALHKTPAELHIAAATDSSADLTARAEGALIEASFFVRAALSATAAAVGAVVRAHTIVALGGVGNRHNGKYLCAGVTHTIDEGAHAMNIELIRNALEV